MRLAFLSALTLRGYDVSQLSELSRILALKALGLSLEQIAKLVQEDVSAEEIRGMFTLRKSTN